ncbi:MAG: indole-3-glycerol phosphate synthase TrpC [Rickettsiales bacterium]|jgi:indole-3-glycerol phosphate synthase|nr:indole-3-glycerol phosphate synthase TrpC [Rickettsiales bacterium]
MSKLQEIIEYKKEFVASRKSKKSLAELKATCLDLPRGSNFINNIQRDIAENDVAYICEIKKASPSQGDINVDVDVAVQANLYKEMGASCLSVLTDEKYFKGEDSDVSLAKRASDLPILRKDFIIDPYQIYEAKIIGSSAILLIMAGLSLEQAQEYEGLANSLGLDVLVESHNEVELLQAIKLKTPLIGINNRDLTTLKIDLKTTAQIAKFIPKDKIIISESGIKSQADMDYLKLHGAQAFLIGTSLMEGELLI